MDLHISLVGRKDLTGEIYRQIRHAMSTAGSGPAIPCRRAASWPAGSPCRAPL